MTDVRKIRIGLVGLLVACFSQSPLISHASVSSDPTPPHTIRGLDVRDAWLAYHPVGGGPALFFDGAPGSGPSQLQVVTQLYPQVAASLTPAETAALAKAHVGSNNQLTVLSAVSPATSTTLTTGNSACPDSNDCDYYEIVFQNTGTFNGYNTQVNEFIDAYRDNGVTVKFNWHWQQFSGTDGPFGQYHDWNPNNWHQNSNGNHYVGNNTYDYDTTGSGNGSWSVVNFCFCVPPSASVALYDNMYAAYCVNQVDTWPGGGTGTVTEEYSQGATAYDAGDNVLGYGTGTFQTCG